MHTTATVGGFGAIGKDSRTATLAPRRPDPARPSPTGAVFHPLLYILRRMLLVPARLRNLRLRTLLALLLLLAAPAAARAQIVVHVGGEPEVDSLTVWAADAKARFQSSSSDSVTDENYRAFEEVGLIGRRLLRSLARGRLLQAQAIQQTLDSLGFATEVAEDPAWPSFALLMVRNPSRFSGHAVGFLYWYRQDDLRMQGVVFSGGRHPSIKVWRSNKPEFPYEWGILDQILDGRPQFTLLGLSPDGAYWQIEQDEESARLFGGPGEAAWVDVNRDGIPEIASWTRDSTDSLFTECMDCPKLLTERLYAEGGEGFELEDERLLPTTYATLVYFVRLLIDGKLTQAERLVRDPARVREAVAQGWNKRVVKNPWQVESRERGQAWPRRLGLRFEGPHGVKRYNVVFGRRGERWIIENWIEPKPVTGRYPSVTVPPVQGAKRPAVKPSAGAKPPAKAPPVQGAPAVPKKK